MPQGAASWAPNVVVGVFVLRGRLREAPCAKVLVGVDLSGHGFHTIDHLPAASHEIKLVACADKLHNARSIQRDYILRPTLPTIITNFALTLIGVWTGAPILETPGPAGFMSG